MPWLSVSFSTKTAFHISLFLSLLLLWRSWQLNERLYLCGGVLKSVTVETGNLPDFRKIPFAAELFTKDRWTGIPEIPGAQQAKTMPDA